MQHSIYTNVNVQQDILIKH